MNPFPYVTAPTLMREYARAYVVFVEELSVNPSLEEVHAPDISSLFCWQVTQLVLDLPLHERQLGSHYVHAPTIVASESIFIIFDLLGVGSGYVTAVLR